MSKKEITDSKEETGDENDAVEDATSTDEAEVSQDWTPESARKQKLRPPCPPANEAAAYSPGSPCSCL